MAYNQPVRNIADWQTVKLPPAALIKRTLRKTKVGESLELLLFYKNTFGQIPMSFFFSNSYGL